MKLKALVLLVSFICFHGIRGCDESLDCDEAHNEIDDITTSSSNGVEETTLKPIEKKNSSKTNSLTDDIVVASYYKFTVKQLRDWEPPADLRKNYPYYLSGFDEEKRPIWIAEVGKMDLRKLIESGRADELDLYTEQAMYQSLIIFKNMSVPSKPVNQVIFIFDADNYDISQITHPATVAYLIQLTRKYTSFGKDHLYKGYIINVNYVAQTLINMVRPILGNLMEKIDIYGTNKGKWIPQLIRQLPVDQIPPWYGGSKSHKPVRIYG